jgi:hypothetical protein
VDLEPLPAIILAIAEQRSLAAVLKTIIDAVARQPGVALARVWLRQSDESCPTCCSGELRQETALHLRASAALRFPKRPIGRAPTERFIAFRSHPTT